MHNANATITAAPIPLTRGRAIGLLIVTAVLWSTSGLLIKLSDWQPFSILAGRSVLAAGVFLLYLRGRRFRVTWLHVVGATAFLATQALYITSIKMTTAANAIFLQYTAPIYVMVLGAWLLNEPPTRADGASMLLVMAGMGLFFGDQLSFGHRLTSPTMVGSLLALISGVTMAVMTIALRAQKDGDPAETLLLAYAAGTLLGAPAMARETWTWTNTGIILFLGIVQIGLAFVLYSMAIKVVRALEATLIATLEPILNPIWVFLVIGEAPGPMALLGALLVIGGVTARATRRS
jgi:drug/metabolite transporter (DMT)-like permease